MHLRTRLEEWRDAQPPSARGCGCVGLVGIGLLAGAFLMGALMGDYGGPPEGRAHDIHIKNVIILNSFAVLILCVTIGNWLVKKRR